MNKDSTIELNPRKLRNDSILQNPAETAQKNFQEFVDDPILPLKMNQAKIIWKYSLKSVYDPILLLWLSQAKTIWKNSLKLQMTVFCRCG